MPQADEQPQQPTKEEVPTAAAAAEKSIHWEILLVSLIG